MEAAPAEERERLIAEAIGARYSPWLHLALPSLIGLAAVAAGLVALRRPGGWDAAFAAGLILVGNGIEWAVHRGAMHRPGGGALHASHALVHHRVYRRGDMAIRGARELRVVLLKGWAIAAGLGIASPAMAALWLLGRPNFAALVAVVVAGHMLAYEWIHLACHLPEGRLVALPPLAQLRRRHALHHDPAWSTRYNFNVTLPLADLLLGTDGGRR